jgi:hypothetical protein
LQRERESVVAVSQFPRGTTLLDDLEFEWFLVRFIAFQDWQRTTMAFLETPGDASPEDSGL